jgi:Na+/melibiose symporter-like transporter
VEQWNDGILGPFVLHLVEKLYGSWDLTAIALDILSLIWALLFFSEVLGITMTSTGVAGG